MRIIQKLDMNIGQSGLGLVGAFHLVVLAWLLMSSAENLRASAQVDSSPIKAPQKDLYHEGWTDFNKNGKKDVYEDSSASLDARIDDLLAQMTLDEKTCQLATLYGYRRVLKDQLPTAEWKNEVWKDGIANIDEHLSGVIGHNTPPDITENVWPPANHVRALNEVQRWFVEETRLGIPVDFTNEGLRGLSHANATSFPPGSSIGATWDRDLVKQIGRVTGSEAFALGYSNIYSPILDVARDQRWGRIEECYGEEPYLVAELGIEQAKALQAAGVGSTLKHYALYSVPKGGRDGSGRTDVAIAPREMRLLFLEPFKRVIAEAKPIGVMSSYNDYDGVPISGSHKFLTDILRGEFGFEGYVVSDSAAVEQIHGKYHVVESATDAPRQFLEAGGNVRTDFNNPENHFLKPIRDQVKSGKLSEKVVDDRVRDVLRVKFKLGLFDRPYRDPAKADAVIASEEHLAVSLRAARESITLLRNEGNLLPLNPNLKNVLVCGPTATDTSMPHGRYGPPSGNMVTLLDGVKAMVSPETKVVYLKGCEIKGSDWPKSEILPIPIDLQEKKLIDEAVAAAAQADAVILCLGDSHATVGEALSRTSLDLPGRQEDLARALIATGKPVVVVLTVGRPASINWIAANTPAILTDWFPGAYSGQAVAEAIFGKLNPGGKSTFTWPRSIGQIPFNFPFKPNSQAPQSAKEDPNGSGVSSVNGAIYPFGFGLSYTTFAYSDLKIAQESVKAGEAVQVSCKIKNTGNREGDEVVQLYLHDEVSSVSSYVNRLAGFERISLKPGEEKTVSFSIQPRDMEMINRDDQRLIEPGKFTVTAGPSSQDLPLKGSFEVK